jgi:hypothetical protein
MGKLNSSKHEVEARKANLYAERERRVKDLIGRTGSFYAAHNKMMRGSRA